MKLYPIETSNFKLDGGAILQCFHDISNNLRRELIVTNL